MDINFSATLQQLDIPPLGGRPICGIYMIEQISTGLRYVGQSVDIAVRLGKYQIPYQSCRIHCAIASDPKRDAGFRWAIVERRTDARVKATDEGWFTDEEIRRWAEAVWSSLRGDDWW